MNAADDYKLQNKHFDEHMYNEAKEIHDLFTSNENLHMLNHEFDSKK